MLKIERNNIMKKFRCPHCGEECITTYKKLLLDEDGKAKIRESYKSFECKICHEPIYHTPKYDNSLHNVYGYFMIFLSILMVVVGFVSKTYVLLIFALLLFWLYKEFIQHIYPYLFFAFVNRPCDYFSSHEFDSEANAVVELEKTLAVDNLDIFAIKFKASTDNVKFHEAFIDDQVPTVFYKATRKQRNPIFIRIMKTEFIPDELLKVGVRFTVISNHKEITTGKIIKLL